MFSVYVLYSKSANHHYTGRTSDLKKRLQQHNSNLCRSTKNRGPWELVREERFLTLGEAARREKELKTGKG